MTQPNEIPEGARELLRGALRSIEQLETLIALHKDPSRTWTIDQLAKELGFRADSVLVALEGLIALRFAGTVGESPARYEYVPQLPARERAVGELATAYEHNRGELLLLISSQAIERVRSGVPKMFSDSLGGPGKKSGD